jgi:hypothetical protein
MSRFCTTHHGLSEDELSYIDEFAKMASRGLARDIKFRAVLRQIWEP